MSKLYAKVSSDNGRTEVTRQAHRDVTTWVQTEYGRLTITMQSDGSYTLTRDVVYNYAAIGQHETLACGNVNTREWYPMTWQTGDK